MNDPKSCQLQALQSVAEGKAEDYHPPFRKRLIDEISCRLSPRFKMHVKLFLFEPKQWFQKFVLKQKKTNTAILLNSTQYVPLKAGDIVRVRMKEEIIVTLDRWHQLNGCSFMSEMYQYCGTVQTVFKPVHRFVDERDRSVKRTRGVVLLKDIYCQGTISFGPCDRSCLYFWREEWLERIKG